MATPEGTIAETSTPTDAAAVVADGLTIDERSKLAFQQLESGADPKVVNKGFNAPFKDKGEGSEETATEDPDEATGATDAKKKPADKAGDDEHRTNLTIAKKALQRDAWTEEDLALLPDERIIEMGQKRLEAQAAIDRKFSESGKNGDGDDSEVSTADADEFLDEIGEYDEELGGKVKAGYEKLAKEKAELKRELDRQKLQVVVDKAKSEFPELKDNAVLDRVIAKMKQLAQSSAYQSSEDIFNDACSICLSGEREQAAQAKLLTENREQRDGQIDTFVDTDPETKPMTQDEKQSYGYKLLTKHGLSAKDVKARLAKIPDA